MADNDDNFPSYFPGMRTDTQVAPNPAVLGSLEPGPHRPAVTIRQAGDRQVLVEYGPMTVDLQLNFRVQALWQILKDAPIHGVTESAPGFRSLLITYDPAVVKRSRVVSELTEREFSAPSPSSLILPSRILRLPIAFDDEMTREAVRRYRMTTRADAPNVVDGDNIDYIVRYNGFSDREAFIDAFIKTRWWNAFMGYFPGLPSLFSLDPRAQITVPKYNPARMWTAEGAVGIGGPCVVLYPMEVPGSYQLFGRTLPLRVRANSTDALMPGANQLFRVGDRVEFYRVTEDELSKLRLRVFEGAYEYDITPSDFSASEHVTATQTYAVEAAEIAQVRREASSKMRVP